MRYMIIVKATEESEAGVIPPEDLIDEMAEYHEKLAEAGVLVDGAGLQASSKGWRIDYDGEKRSVTDGPFAETKELIAGYTIINVDSPQEALDWAMRFPNPSLDRGKAQIEVRRFFEMDDFEPSAAVERHRQLQERGNN